MGRTCSFAIGLLAFALIATPGFSNGPCPFEALLPDTAIEIEPRVIPKGAPSGWTHDAKQTLGLFTTSDGTLKPLLANGPFPPALIARLVPYQKDAAVEGIRWEDLDGDLPLQHALLVAARAAAHSTFAQSRKVPGVVLRSKVYVRFSRPMELFGHSYPAGERVEVDLSNILKDPAVEIGGPEAEHDLSYFEFHLRGNVKSSGALQSDTWTLLEALGVSKDRAHVHTLGPANREALRQNDVAIAQRVEHYRRTNLAAEMISVVDKRLPINEIVGHSGLMNWGSLTNSSLYRVYKDLSRYAATGTSPTGDPHKLAYVSFHFPSKYDGDIPLFGYQFRSVDKRRRGQFESLLDGAQQSLNQSTHLIPAQEMIRWKQSTGNTWEIAVTKLWYRNPANDLLTAASPESKQLLQTKPFILQRLNEYKTTNLETGMLTYDWAADPLFIGLPELQTKIRQRQALALERIGQGLSPPEELRSFLTESGIYERVIGSVSP
jgi:hypothetical protein